jgi:glutathione S-transferase
VARPHRFISICFSHYVERARWGLERLGAAYEEEPHLPFFHGPFVWRAHWGRAGRGDRASTRLSTPVLITPENECIADSRGILDYLDRSIAAADQELYPTIERANEFDLLERRWHDKLATHARRLAYSACFAAPGALEEIARRNVGGREASLFVRLLPLIEPAMRRYLRMDEQALEHSREVCLRELDQVAAQLDDGRRYLTGDDFTGWDLSFASFASPLVLPPEYGAWIPDPSRLDDEARSLVSEMRAHPAGKFALRLFSEHRRQVVRGRPSDGNVAGASG